VPEVEEQGKDLPECVDHQPVPLSEAIPGAI
jgi:hypothetical protein